MVRNIAEANEASLAAANWCFNLWLRLSRRFSLPARRLRGTSAEQTFRLQTFILTFTSFSERQKKTTCSSFIRMTGTSQTRLPSWQKSKSERCPEVSWGEEGSTKGRKCTGERGRSDGGMEVAGVCQEMTREMWLCIIMVAGLSPPEARLNTLSKAHRRSWLQIDFFPPPFLPISTPEWVDRWLKGPINELPRCRNIKDGRFFFFFPPKA